MATPEQLDAWTTAGLYDPKASSASERLEVLELLVDGEGVSATELAALGPSIDLGWVPLLHWIRTEGQLSLSDLAEHSGWGVGELADFLGNSGLPVPAVDAPAFEPEYVEVFAALHEVGAVFSASVGPKLAQVMGTSLGALAEAVVAALLAEIYDPEVETGRTELERVSFNLSARDALVSSMNAIAPLLTLHLRAAATRWMATADQIETGSLRIAVGFIDLVGFTGASRGASPEELRRLVTEFGETAYQIVSENGGRLVKLIGDAVMYTAESSAQACNIGLGFVDRFRERRKDMGPRGGVAMGNLLAHQGDYYGPVVNLSARIAEQAVPDEILVAHPVPTEATADPGLCFDPAGRRMLKGFEEPVELWSVTRRRG
ncbi:MAG: adenylate/guanylate cyclase domain-containing protein [Actinobacteria bacterium]|nr:MAG: adenylate/guanylate cyclase domain-containing protein [Actinomycetota bacterium]RIK07169.1 MAG: hypothetical protein DCC48_05140 [Acidobacteriota bacterium]